MHRDLYEMAAAYLFHLVKNHPFIDGNKRIGLAVAILFLEQNGVEVKADNRATIKIVLDVAQNKLQKLDVADFFRANTVPR